MKLGETYALYGEKTRGANVLQKAIDKDPFFVIAWLNKAKILAEVNN